MTIKTKTLVEELLRDRAERIARKSIRTVSTTKVERAEFDPFKVTRWRVVAGGDPGYLVATPARRIECRACQREFESRGWAYCPTCKALAADKRRVPSKTGRPCECPGCTHRIPKWRNGRQVSKAARFCSARCARRAREMAPGLSDIGPPGFVTPNAKEVPVNGGSKHAPLNLVGGGRRWPSTLPLEPGLRQEIVNTEIGANRNIRPLVGDGEVLLTASSKIHECSADTYLDPGPIPDFLRRAK
jgi:hypothetical protein